MPTYKRPDKLKRAVESVLNQTFGDFEIVIVNNANEDVILPIQDNRITLLQEKQKGANFARNKGIKNSNGEFICFLDDDDVYLENHLNTLHDLIKSNGEKVGLYRTFTKVELSEGVFEDQKIITKDEGETELDHLLSVLLVMHCVCCHREVLLNVTFDPEIKVAQDYHLWIRILSKYPIFEAPKITTIYYKTEDSISSPSMEKYFLYIDVYGSLFKQKNISAQLSKKIINTRMIRYYDLLLSCYYKELSIKRFIRSSINTTKYNIKFIFSVHYLKLFIKFWMYKIIKK